MKKNIHFYLKSLPLLICILIYSQNASSQNLKSFVSTESVTKGGDEDLSKKLPIIRFSGLGSVSNSTEKISVDPSANIIAQINFSKKKRGTFYIGYNLGSQIDSTSIDSIKLSSLFFPDKSTNGFTTGFSYDILRTKIFSSWKIKTIESPGKIDGNAEKYYYFSLEPYVEYAYLKKNIKDEKIVTPRIQTSTWLIGVRFGGFVAIESNSFGVQINSYYKAVNITDATYDTYNSIFKPFNNNKDLPNGNSLLGINLNLQINKVILGFTYEELLTKRVINTDIYGGVFILKATVAADFFDFK